MGRNADDFAGSPGQSFLVARDKLANGLLVGIDLKAKVVANGVTHNLKATSSNPILPTPVVSKNINDSGLLVTLEPTSDGDDQQGSGLALPPHDRGF